MALLDVLMEHARTPDSTQMFVDCSNDAGTETSVGELLTLLTNARQVPNVGMLEEVQARREGE
jgi:hypothetical protein